MTTPNECPRCRVSTVPQLPGQAVVLTDRERDVLSHLVDGLTNAQIGEALFICESTARSHVRHLLQKLDARNRAQLVAHAFRRGYIPIHPTPEEGRDAV